MRCPLDIDPPLDGVMPNERDAHSHLAYLSKAAVGTVDYWKLESREKKSFDVARKGELQSLLDLNAYRLLSLEESLEFRRKFPEHVLPSGGWIGGNLPMMVE